MTYTYATVMARKSDRSSIDLITDWLSRWSGRMPLRLEKSENRQKIFEVMAPREAFTELPRELVREGIEW